MFGRSYIEYVVGFFAKVLFVMGALGTTSLEVQAERRAFNLAAPRVTRLRSAPPTVIISQTPSGLFATYSSVMVRNVGRIEAKNIRISMLLDFNVATRLTGPQKLAPNEYAVYSSSKKLPIPRRSRPRVLVSCSNCRR